MIRAKSVVEKIRDEVPSNDDADRLCAAALKQVLARDVNGAIASLSAIKTKTEETNTELPARWLHELGDLSEAPPKLSWFVSDLRTGAKLLRRGKCIVLAADGGVGKSFFWLMLAVCTALGIALFDVFLPEEAGYVALLMGEDDAAECLSRVWRICNALHLDREQRELVARRIFIFPLAGHEVSLLQSDEHKVLHRTEAFEAIVKRLTDEAKKGGFEWSFVGIDPLARFASENAESSNKEATSFVQTLESIALRVPGDPAIGCTHHASKVSVRAGGADVRGVTGIRNAFRASFTLVKVKADGVRGVLFENGKNNYAPEANPLWLVQLGNEELPGGGWLETGGVLAPANEEQIAKLASAAGVAAGDPDVRRQDRETKRDVAKFAKAEMRRSKILACLPVDPEHTTTAGVEAEFVRQVVPNLGKTTAELRELVELGKARDLSDGGRGTARRWCRIRGDDK